MAIDIELTPELEAKLKKMAAAAGKDVATLAREILERKARGLGAKEPPPSRDRGNTAGEV